jgi:tRNA-2-methylthio-N6-dimethylallyladenosine synthase
VPHEVKIARLERLQKLQRKISSEITSAQVGLEVQVLVEGHSRYDAAKRFGRTPENRTVNFEGDAPAGALVTVLVERATPNQLMGRQTALVMAPTVMPPPAAEVLAGVQPDRFPLVEA